MNYREKIAFIFATLQPHGLYISGAKDLAGIDGIVALLEAERLPGNDGHRPECPVAADGRTGKATHEYRLAMTKYLEPCIQLPPVYPLTVFEALADFCESRVNER